MRSILIVIVLAACATESANLPPPLVDHVSPSANCRRPAGEASPQLVVSGAGFVDDDGFRVTLINDRDGRQVLGAAQVITEELVLAEIASLATPISDATPTVHDVEVTNPDGQISTLPQTFTLFPDIALSGVVPASAPRGSVSLRFTGRGFYGRLQALLGGEPTEHATEVTVMSPTEAVATFELGSVAPGDYSITVRNEAGCDSTIDLAFTVQ